MTFTQNDQKNAFPYWAKLIIVLCLGWTVIWIYRQALPAVYPEIGVDLNITNTQLGFIATCYFFAYTSMQIPAGILVDKFGQRVVMIPGFILFMVAPLIIALSSTIEAIYFASVLAGLGCGTYYGSAFSLSSQNIPAEKRGLSTAIINSGSAVGMAIALIGSSLLVKKMGYSWQTMMYIASALILIMVFVFMAIIRSQQTQKLMDKAEKAKVAASAQPEVDDGKSTLQRLFSVNMLASYFLYFGTCYGYYMIVTWLPKFLQSERGFEGVAIGFAAALVAFASIPGALLFSRISDKFRHKKVTMIVLLQVMAILMLLSIISAKTETLLLVALIAYGFFGKLAVEPIIISYLGDTAPKKGFGTTLGVFNCCGMASSVLAPPITGRIIDVTTSQTWGFYLAAIFLFVSTLLFFIANASKK